MRTAIIRGGWSVPFHDDAAGEAIGAGQGDVFDLLLGRKTYDIFSGFWPKAESGPMTTSINSATKYVATQRPESLAWGPAEALGSDIVAGIRRIKAQGKRLFPDGTPPREFALVGSKAVPSGVIISTYTPTGPLRTGSF